MVEVLATEGANHTAKVKLPARSVNTHRHGTSGSLMEKKGVSVSERVKGRETPGGFISPSFEHIGSCECE